MAEPRYYIQSEQVRFEPRMYWVMDKQTDSMASKSTRNKRTAGNPQPLVAEKE